MFSFYPSHPRALRYSSPVYSVYPDDDLYAPYLSSHDSRPQVINPEVRYRRALGEYLAAEEAYNTLLRTREEAKLRARAEAIRQERARLRLVRLARARREQQARQFEQGLAKVLTRAAVSGDDIDLLHHVVPVTVMYQTSDRPLSDMFYGEASCADGASVQMEKVCGVRFQPCLHSVLIRVHAQAQVQRDAEETNVDQSAPLPASGPGECECSVSSLECVLRERLQKIAGDEEVQDLARSILRHLTSATGVSPSAAASSPEVGSRSAFFINVLVLIEVKLNTLSTQPDEGANLSRSHALKGVAAEAAKASFKAHRAEVAEPSQTSPTPRTVPSSLSIIEDIRSALTKLSAGFSLPHSLDFSDDELNGLAYTPANAPVRVYEHALNKLLEQLDAVESEGDEEVRVVRRAAVKEVEKAIEDVEKRIREARESARPGGSPGLADSAEADLTKNEVEEKSCADNEVEEPASNSVDSALSRPEILAIPNLKVAIPYVDRPTDPKPLQDDDIVKDQSSTPVSGSVFPTVSMASPSPAPAEQIEATVSTDELKHDSEVFAEQVSIDQITSVLLEPETLITPPDSPREVSVPTRGAIAPSSTPIAPLVPSVITDELPASLSGDQLPVPLGEDDAELYDADGEGEWTEI